MDDLLSGGDRRRLVDLVNIDRAWLKCLDCNGVEYFMFRLRAATGFVLLSLLASQSPASAASPGYFEAARGFENSYTLQQRVLIQVFMTSAGYWNGVPNENFSERLFKSIEGFQASNGFVPNGILSEGQMTRLAGIGGEKLDVWGFRKVSHPTRGRSVWIPFGLDLKATVNEYGLHYIDPQQRVLIDFTTVPHVAIGRNFAALVYETARAGAQIHYKVMKDDWFVISATTPDGVDHYIRYHQDRANVTGFTLSWNNAHGNVNGERIAILMSASLYSDMTGAPFMDPPTSEAKPGSTPRTQQAVAKPDLPPAPKDDKGFSSGSGFFVDQEGSFVTNAHVVEECSQIRVKADDGVVYDARKVAVDTTNDLALLRLPKTPRKSVSLRIGVRLGEGVEAFGFPHSDLLSSSGNFTLGNVTALSGVKDDSRFLQISAPVQAGNSGGPLLDQSGNLVGVVTAKLDAIKLAMADGDFPQNVNFAVKSTVLAIFLDSHRVAVTTGTVAPKPMDPSDIADQARAMSGFILCH